MQPRHRFVPFVEAKKHRLKYTRLFQLERWNFVADGTVINWGTLSSNPSPDAMALLRAHPEKIYWYNFSRNPCSEAVAMLQANPDKIVWHQLCRNTHPDALAMLALNPRYIDWEWLSFNPAATALIQANFSMVDRDFLCGNPTNPIWPLLQICWQILSMNPSPKAMQALQANPERICWHGLSRNPSPQAIAMLEANPDNIDWEHLSENPGIFEMDYPTMRTQMTPLRDELLRHAMHPRNLNKARYDWLLF
jgi:hypothetical protein